MGVFEAFLIYCGLQAAGGVIGNASYDILVKLKEKIGSYFNSEEEVDKFLELTSTTEVVNEKKPFRDIEDIYEIVTKSSYNEGLVNEMKAWVLENKSDLEQVFQTKIETNSGINIGSQRAGRDIYNIKGDLNKNVTG